MLEAKDLKAVEFASRDGEREKTSSRSFQMSYLIFQCPAMPASPMRLLLYNTNELCVGAFFTGKYTKSSRKVIIAHE